MYPLNHFFPQGQFIATTRHRTGLTPVGSIDGANDEYLTPFGDKFVHNLPFLSIQVYFNGIRLTLLDDFTIDESGGSGSGFDTVILAVPPKVDDHVLVDYVATN